MTESHCALLLIVSVGVGGLALHNEGAPRSRDADERWKLHPALAEPDGRSHRGDTMLGVGIDDPRVLAELSRRFRRAQPLRFVGEADDGALRGADDFETRQEYFLRLLDHYWFAQRRLVGMTRAEVEGIFGPLGDVPDRAMISAGRDTLHLWFESGRVRDGYYSMGY